MQICKKIIMLLEEIEKTGKPVNGTMELTGVTFSKIDVTNSDILAEENAVRDYYTSLGINTQAIRSLEHNLYEFIYRGLKQSIEQLFYFDKTQDYKSRRFTFSTTDCISHVQMLYRDDIAELFVYIRSTDVKKLLPWDMLFSLRLINRILSECNFPPVKKKYITIVIGSAHFYLKPASMY